MKKSAPVDKLKVATKRVAQLEDVLRKIAARRPSEDRAATAFYRCRADAKEALRDG